MKKLLANKFNCLILMQFIFFVPTALYGLISIEPNSDWLVFPATVRDIFNHVNIRGWCVNAAPSYFPDITIFLFLNSIIPDWQVALRVFNIVSALFIPLGALIFKKIYDGKSSNIFTIGILFFFNIILYDNKSIHDLRILQQLGISLHIGTVGVFLICVALFFKLLRNPKPWTYSLFSVLIILEGASDFLFQVVFTVPMIILLIFLIWLHNDAQARKSYLNIGGLTLASAVTGYFANSFFVSDFFYYVPQGIPKTIVSGQFGINWHHLPVAWKTFIFGCNDCFTRMPVFTSLILMAVFGVIMQAIIHIVQKKRLTADFILISFAVICIIVDVTITIVTVGVVSVSDIRYMYPCIFLSIVISLVMLERWNIERLFVAKIVLTMLVVLSLLIDTQLMVSLKRHFPHFSAHYYPELAQFLDDNKDKYGLHNGFSEYWKTHLITMYSRKGITVNGLRNGDLRINYWDNNLELYRHKDYNFIIVDADEKRNGIKRVIVDKIIGKPDKILEDRSGSVYIYEHNQLNRWYQLISQEYLLALYAPDQ